MTTIVNLTPHDVHVIAQDGTVTTFPRQGASVRYQTLTEPRATINDIPVFKTVFGAVEGLPEATEDIVYIVSTIVRNACPDRTDLVSPGELVRNADGVVIGKNFAV